MARLTNGDGFGTTVSSTGELRVPSVVDAGSSTWEQRMAQRATRRARIAREADAEARGEGEQRQAAWRAFVEERGGHSARLVNGWFEHGAPGHGNMLVDAATGAGTGMFTIVPNPDAQPAAECAVCRDFRQYWHLP